MAAKGGAAAASAMPPCPTQPWIAYAGWAAFLPAVLGTWALGMPMPWRLAAILALPAGVIIGLEAAYERPALRTGLQFQRWRPAWPAVGFKLAALAAIFGAIGLFEWSTSEYGKRMYRPYFELLRAVGPWAALAGAAYVAAVDGWQTDEAKAADRYHNLGRLLLGRGAAASLPPGCWAGLAREWGVKAFFLPLMLAFAANSVQAGDEYGLKFLDALRRKDFHFMHAYSFLYELIFYCDVIWASIGYIFSFKLLDTHVRSAEPTFAGWLAALSCYPPLNGAVIDAYLAYSSEDTAWGVVFRDVYPLYCAWGAAILGLCGVYLWATIMFGVRFSNLTNRGVITTGPYAWSRHPAYLAKNAAWWLIATPWCTREGAGLAAKRCARLALVNAIYYARAMTEEAHLLADPAYRAYYDAVQRRYGLPLFAEQQQQREQPERPEQRQRERERPDGAAAAPPGGSKGAGAAQPV